MFMLGMLSLNFLHAEHVKTKCFRAHDGHIESNISCTRAWKGFNSYINNCLISSSPSVAYYNYYYGRFHLLLCFIITSTSRFKNLAS